MYDKIVIESDSMSWYDHLTYCIQVRDESKLLGEGTFVHIKSAPYGNELNHLKNKRLRVTIEVVRENAG